MMILKLLLTVTTQVIFSQHNVTSEDEIIRQGIKQQAPAHILSRSVQ